MEALNGRKILLAVTGSIAAYKAALIVRACIRAGAEVQVLMTPAAGSFISPLTLSVLSKRPVHDSVIDESAWNNHVELGLWADAMIVAPATAHTLSGMAQGRADSIVLACYLSARCPVFIAPAMDLDMWAHPATQRNLDILKQDGVHLLDVTYGELASGLIGKGRMMEPEDIVSALGDFFKKSKSLEEKKILINAGPTHETIDPVRFIGNRSTGKMGLAIAREAISRGAEVHLVLGPISLPLPDDPRLHIYPVQTAAQMYDRCLALWPQMDIAVLAAAVADYTPRTVSDSKIKKKEGLWQLELQRTQDIAAAIGRQKADHQYLIGFALETDDILVHATKKIDKKNLDFIVINSPRVEGAAFGHDTNQVSFLYPDGRMDDYSLKSKDDVAVDIWTAIETLIETL